MNLEKKTWAFGFVLILQLALAQNGILGAEFNAEEFAPIFEETGDTKTEFLEFVQNVNKSSEIWKEKEDEILKDFLDINSSFQDQGDFKETLIANGIQNSDQFEEFDLLNMFLDDSHATDDNKSSLDTSKSSKANDKSNITLDHSDAMEPDNLPLNMNVTLPLTLGHLIPNVNLSVPTEIKQTLSTINETISQTFDQFNISTKVPEAINEIKNFTYEVVDSVNLDILPKNINVTLPKELEHLGLPSDSFEVPNIDQLLKNVNKTSSQVLDHLNSSFNQAKQAENNESSLEVSEDFMNLSNTSTNSSNTKTSQDSHDSHYGLTQINPKKFVSHGKDSFGKIFSKVNKEISDNLSKFFTTAEMDTECKVGDVGPEVCGSDGRTYKNLGFLFCAQRINKDLEPLWDGPCDRTEWPLAIFSNKKMKILNPSVIHGYVKPLIPEH